MEEKKGLFVVFEGIDGSGKSTQVGKLEGHVRSENKYQDVLLTREPTWRSKLKEILRKEKDSFAHGKRDAELFIGDRKSHYHDQIAPALEQRELVICDRYTLSTLGYQSTQGVPLPTLVAMHKDAKISPPDLTFYVNVSRETAATRMAKRGDPPEKFEGDIDFVDKLVRQYGILAEMSKSDGDVRDVLGEVYLIDGERTPSDISEDIRNIFDPVYEAWLAA